MSSNKTPNLGMHHWESQDPIVRDEFNENFNKLDTIVNNKVDKELLTAELAKKVDNTTLTSTVNKIDNSITTVNGRVDTTNTKVSTLQNKKITADDGKSLINVESGSLLNAIKTNASLFATFCGKETCTDLPFSGISIRGVKVFDTLTSGWIVGTDNKDRTWTNFYNGSTWQGWKVLDNFEATELKEGHGYTLETLPPGRYFYSSIHFPEAAPHGGSYYGYLEVIYNENNPAYRVYRHLNSYYKYQYINTYHNGVFRGWQADSYRYEVLWSGSTAGDFTSTFTLAEPLTNYDFVYFVYRTPAGVFSGERFIHVDSIPATTDLICSATNITDTEGSYVWSLHEFAFTFNAEKTNFRFNRSIRISFNGVASASRGEQAENVGLTKIVGVKI